MLWGGAGETEVDMGIFSETADSFRRGLEGDDVFVEAGVTVTCSHCAGQHFERDSRQINSAGLTFLGLDWANKSATVYVCKNCGHVEWFI